MVLAPERTIEEQTSEGSGKSQRYCDGCPRCNPPGEEDPGFCKSQHPEWKGLHPVCRKCGHCVLRGKHNDNTDDLQ